MGLIVVRGHVFLFHILICSGIHSLNRFNKHTYPHHPYTSDCTVGGYFTVGQMWRSRVKFLSRWQIIICASFISHISVAPAVWLLSSVHRIWTACPSMCPSVLQQLDNCWPDPEFEVVWVSGSVVVSCHGFLVSLCPMSSVFFISVTVVTVRLSVLIVFQ